ncbi:hypothetical protein K501DRAFT_337981 [Backusella circina FSU 941]|nr:hypothetical protein K501DRAFT_337981 [Backusella circina FSU 941]
MFDPSTSNNVADINVPRRMFTQEVNKIVAEVTKRVRETQVEESDQRQGSDLPKLQRVLKKFKRGTHKDNNQEWVTAETTNPDFINQLKETKVDTAQLVNTIYRLTENTRVQAKAATELYEHLKYIMNRGLRREDLQIFQDSIEKNRRLAVYWFGVAKQQENEAKEITIKSLKLPHSFKHLEITSSRKLHGLCQSITCVKKRILWIVFLLHDHQTEIQTLKQQGFTVIGYARMSKSGEDIEIRTKLLNLMYKYLKERSLVNHVFASYSSQANDQLANE